MTKIRQLLTQFKPKHYNLTIIPDVNSMTFTGHVEILGKITTDSNVVTLHSKDLNLTKATINGQIADIGKQSSHHEVDFTVPNQLTGDNCTITAEFNGKITSSMVGIYVSPFKINGETKKIIATQLESNHAREVFPCIDEPAAKATFELTLHSATDEVALSNTPISEQATDGNTTITKFEPTPIMSSYLLAFVAGDMHCVERTSTNGTTIKAWGSAAQPSSYLDYSADEAVKLLDFFEGYFDTPFPLEKCDLVALPDFDAGAMENWGLITFREIAMLADMDNRSISSEQYVSMVVAHELSHMWFGNLVTMEWWDDLWLNESFASIMEHIALDAIHPEWHQWEHYASSDILSTTSRDIHQDIQPISIELDDPDLMETMFDPGIVYTKGGRLLKMLREHIGDDAFRAGLKNYFDKHAYKNATRNDLWTSLAGTCDKDVDALMTGWLEQPGMPLLTVDQKGKTLKLSQKRFVVGGDVEDKQTWPIPLLSKPTFEPAIFNKAELTTKLDDDEFRLINESASGHYITHYKSAEHREYIRTKLVDATIDSPARINILNDIILLSRNQIVNYTEALGYIAGMKNEDRFTVWTLIARIISGASHLTEGDEEAKKIIQKLRSSLAGEKLKKLGYDDLPSDDPNTTQLRSMMLSMMVSAEDRTTMEYIKSAMDTAKTPENLPSESRDIILSALIRDGDKALANTLIENYPSASSDMQLDTLSAISITRSPEFAKEILAKAVGETGFVRSQDTLRLMALFLRNHHIRDAAWAFMVDNWTTLNKIFNDSKSFDFLPTICASIVTTDEMAKKYRDLFEPLSNNKILKRNITIGLRDIESRVEWRKANEATIKQWLINFDAS